MQTSTCIIVALLMGVTMSIYLPMNSFVDRTNTPFQGGSAGPSLSTNVRLYEPEAGLEARPGQ